MKKQQIAILLFSLVNCPLFSQNQVTEGVDTTSSGYKIGYEIGSWLPFLIIFTLAIMVMYRARKYSKD